MITEINTPVETVDGAPLDFAEYEAWHKAGREAKESKPADAEAKADASKTATDSETDQTADGDKDEKPQKKSGFQRRIDRLNQKLGASAARIAELERAQGGNAAAPKADAKPAAAEAAEPGKPESKNFDSYEEYVEALADWKLDVREKKRDAERAQREANEAHEAVIAANDATFKERQALYPDWKEKVAAATDIPITQIMHTLITESEFRADLGYYLADNPAEAKRISALSPLRQAAELGKLETTFAKADEKKPATAETQKPRVSKAPAPVKTVRAQAEAGEPDPSDFKAWERWRNAQPGASLRR
jgi:hypothetical protein